MLYCYLWKPWKPMNFITEISYRQPTTRRCQKHKGFVLTIHMGYLQLVSARYPFQQKVSVIWKKEKLYLSIIIDIFIVKNNTCFLNQIFTNHLVAFLKHNNCNKRRDSKTTTKQLEQESTFTTDEKTNSIFMYITFSSMMYARVDELDKRLTLPVMVGSSDVLMMRLCRVK